MKLSKLLFLAIIRVLIRWVNPFSPISVTSKRKCDDTLQSILKPLSQRQSVLSMTRRTALLQSLSMSNVHNNSSKILPEQIVEGDSIAKSSTNKTSLMLPDYYEPRNSSKRSKVSDAQLGISKNGNKGKSQKVTPWGSYFPFLQFPQPGSGTNELLYNAKGRSQNASIASNILNKSANDTITVADLEKFLSEVQVQPYATRVQNPDDSRNSARSANSLKKSGKDQSKSTPSSTKKQSTSSQVAFPQPSIVDEVEVRRGTSIAGCFLGMMIAITILPNLWLVGMIAGSFYGYEITKELSQETGEIMVQNSNVFDKFLVSCGRQLAKGYLKVIDSWKGLWFLYKTGQLSYEYYKTYENLDKKFAIQNKVDAWNRVFVEGKRKFDAWEQENEVGRTVLAGLRTAWLVDEQSKRRAAGRSKYRLVQMAYDLKYSVSRALKKGVLTIRSWFEDGEIETFFRGLRSNISREGSIAVRVGAVGAAIFAINIVGAMFSISPAFCNFIAITVAIIWPSWAAEFVSKLAEIGNEIQSSGKKSERSTPSGNSVQIFDPVKFVRRHCQKHESPTSRKQKSNPKKRRGVTSYFSNTKKGSRRPRIRFGGWRRRRVSQSGEVGTWGGYRKK